LRLLRWRARIGLMSVVPSLDDLQSHSVALSHGFRVSVQSRYLSKHSRPVDHQYVWSYTIRIENIDAKPAKLLTRHWVISDAKGHTEEVRGPGVVGRQPHLAPGQAFEYSSGCPLRTSYGTMRGTFQMSGDDGTAFDIDVAPFLLTLPTHLN
jgi:ApaG protein